MDQEERKKMLLTHEEEKGLSGEYGDAMSIAYRILVAIGEATNAEKLVPINWAHVSGVNYNTIGDSGLEFLKKISADIFISAGNFCSMKASLPQYILMPDPHRLKQVYVQKAQRMIVGSEWEKSKLKAALKIPGSKIEVVYPFVNEKFSPIEPEKREAIKNKYSQGREYFLCTNSFHRPEDLINLLKAFSHFKKRQQSSFQLLLVTAQDASIKEKIANYKYRNDVAFIEPNPIEEAAAITAAAYALVFPIITSEDTSSVLHAMNSAVPVITINHSSINEMAGDAAMYAEDDIKDMGEKMMHLYKDETLRFQLIEKGKERVKNFTIERSASQLWRSVINALN